MMKNLKKITALLLALTLSVLAMFAFTSCGDASCTEHVDSDPKDSKCDNCGKAVDCDDHVDADVNGKCDYCETQLGFVYTVTVVRCMVSPLPYTSADEFGVLIHKLCIIMHITRTITHSMRVFTVYEWFITISFRTHWPPCRAEHI